MPEIAVTVTAAAIVAGSDLGVGYWSTGFDHAALVAAGRSRSDGLDFSMRHTTTGRVEITATANLNTATCLVGFNAAQSASGSDAGYRLAFGNLGSQALALGTPGPAAPGTPVTTGSVPAVALPSPGFPLSRTLISDVAECPYPEWPTPRRVLQNENPRLRYELEWPHVIAEDWYEIRAFLRAQRGGAGSFPKPSWLPDGTLYRIIPGSASFRQGSRLDFSARMTIEEVAA